MISFDAAYALIFMVLALLGFALTGALARVPRLWRKK